MSPFRFVLRTAAFSLPVLAAKKSRISRRPLLLGAVDIHVDGDPPVFTRPPSSGLLLNLIVSSRRQAGVT